MQMIRLRRGARRAALHGMSGRVFITTNLICVICTWTSLKKNCGANNGTAKVIFVLLYQAKQKLKGFKGDWLKQPIPVSQKTTDFLAHSSLKRNQTRAENLSVAVIFVTGRLTFL